MEKILLQLRTLLMISAVFGAAQMANAQSVWNAVVGSSANTNWSTAVNWTPNGVPGSSAAVALSSMAAGADTTTNNVVDSGFGGTIASLSYSDTTTGTFQNTLIANGVTLNVTGTGGLTVGSATVLGSDAAVVNTISGAGGALVVNNASANMNVFLGGPSVATTATLNMSNLNTFSFTGARLLVGVGASAPARASGSLFLARTNTIALSGTSPQMDIGENTGNRGSPSSLYLGQTNVISAGSIAVGRSKQSGAAIQFNPSFTNNNPVAYFRGADGVSPVGTWAIGDGTTTTGTVGSSGTVDFSGGTVNIVATSMWLGRPAAVNTSTSTGTLTLTAGNISVNNLTNALLTLTGTEVATGTINVNGTGTLSVGNFVIANKNGLAGGTANGTLNITNGTVAVGTLTAGGGTSTVNMTGGNLVVTNTVGSVANPFSSLSVNGGATIQLPVVNGVTPVTVANLSSDNSGVINISSLPNISSYPSQPLPLITYSSSGSGVTFSMGTLPGTFTGYISNDNSSTVWVVVTNGPSLSNLNWGGGVNNLWDTNSLNWTNNGVAVKYHNPDFVVFGDSAQTNKVNVTDTFMPVEWTQSNNILNYTFSGSGSITGPATLIMDGNANVTLAETGGDSFSGGITANAGTIVLDDPNSAISGGLMIASGATVQIGNNDTNGALPSGTLDDEGTLVFNRTNKVLVAIAILGGGGLNQNGSGTLILSASNTFTGNTIINTGTLALTNSGSIQNSANVMVNGGGTLDVSGAAGSAMLNNLTLQGGVNLNVKVGYLQTDLNMNSLAMSGINNTINVESLPPIAYYPATVALLNASSGISGYNLVLGTLPSASPAYGGASIAQIGNSVMLTLNSGPTTNARPFVSWSGIDALNDVNTNWSDAQNWQTPGAPVAADYVQFSDIATASGSPFSTVGNGFGGIVSPSYINNIVGASTTISYLVYSNVLADYQNTLLGNGVTLNVVSTNANNSPLLFTVGSERVDFGPSANGFVTIAGTNGTLNLHNTNGTVFISMGNANSASVQATLDLSGLGTFNAAVSTILVGVGGNSEGTDGINHPSGVLYLAQTNVITASVATSGTETSDNGATDVSIDIGDDNGNTGQASYLYLGQTNAIYADAIGVGRQKCNGTMEFNPNLVSGATRPAAYFRGSSANAVTIWSLGDGVVNSGLPATCTGTSDFTGGYLDALVGSMYVGRAANSTSGSGTATGTLNFDNGIFNVGTLYVGYQTAKGAKIGIGTINVNTNTILGSSGTLSVSGSLNLALTTGGTGAASTAGTLNIIGGIVQADVIIGDTNITGSSTINLNGGTLIVTNTAGTASAPITSLNLSSGSLHLNVNGMPNVTNIVATTITTSGTTTIAIDTIVNVSGTVQIPLISYVGADPYSSLSVVTMPAGYTGSLVDNTGNSSVDLSITNSTKPTPHFTGISLSGTTLNISATNGVASGAWALLQSTNVALPLSQWQTNRTGMFDNSGDLSTNIANTATNKQEFYILKQ